MLTKKEKKEMVRDAIMSHLYGTLLDNWEEQMGSGYGNTELKDEYELAAKEVERIAKLFKTWR